MLNFRLGNWNKSGVSGKLFSAVLNNNVNKFMLFRVI